MAKRTSTEAGFPTMDDGEVALKRCNSVPDGPVPIDKPMDANNNAVTVGVSARTGDREEMEDCHVVRDDFRSDVAPVCNIDRFSFYGMFDGHAGKTASAFCAAQFPSKISTFCRKYSLPGNDLSTLEKSIKKVFIDSFKKVDEEYLAFARLSRPPLRHGSTATVLMILNNVLYAANIGDSRAVLCRKKEDPTSYIAMQLTVDHSPMMVVERSRILKAGGFVRDGRVQGIIEVSRSIGDGSFKNVGLSCIPDVKKVTLTDNDKFVLLACDGLWKVFKSDEAVDFVVQRLKGKTHVQLNSRELWTMIADDLSAEAITRKCGDNVSVIILYLNKGV